MTLAEWESFWMGVMIACSGYAVGALILDALIVYGDRLMEWSIGKGS